MARQAEAEREKRAKIIHAAGEFEASKMLSAAARVVGKEKATIQLRYLQTLTEIASERNSTIIFPVPIELLSLIPGIMGGGGKDSGGNDDDDELPPDLDELLAAQTPGSLEAPIAGSEAEYELTKPQASVLNQMNAAGIEAANKQRARFLENDAAEESAADDKDR
jgi:hypothetical protein